MPVSAKPIARGTVPPAMGNSSERADLPWTPCLKTPTAAKGLRADAQVKLPLWNISTKRLRAEKLSENDLADLVELHLDAEVSRYLGGVRSAEATKAYVVVNLEHWAKHGFGLWVLRTHDGEFVGRAGIRHIVVGTDKEVEVVYTLKQASWGQGLASEAVSAMIGSLDRRTSVPSLIGLASLENAASRRVLEKSGFF
jgi:RimJ/RimL family protein N-acetyltransferase